MADTKSQDVIDVKPADSTALARSEAPVPAKSAPARVLPMPPPPRDENLAMRDETYAGMSLFELSAEQAAVLMRAPTDDEVEIKPDTFGAVYLGHAGYRKRLNEAFRPMGWAMRPLSPPKKDGDMVYFAHALYVKGHYVGQAIGEQKYVQARGDGGMSWGDAIEGATSNALMRCCKFLGIAMECWNREWTAAFRKRCCVRVFVESRDGAIKPAWRKKDSDPIEGETGVCPDSPNREGYKTPEPAWWQKKGRAAHRDETRSAPDAKAEVRESKAEPPKPVTGAERPIGRADAKLLWAMVAENGMDQQSVIKRIAEKYAYVGNSTELLKRKDFDELKAWIAVGGD